MHCPSCLSFFVTVLLGSPSINLHDMRAGPIRFFLTSVSFHFNLLELPVPFITGGSVLMALFEWILPSSAVLIWSVCIFCSLSFAHSGHICRSLSWILLQFLIISLTCKKRICHLLNHIICEGLKHLCPAESKSLKTPNRQQLLS